MNQSILFNDDLHFDEITKTFVMTGIVAGENIKVFFHSQALNQASLSQSCLKYDLEEIVELWLEKNEPEQGVINIYMK